MNILQLRLFRKSFLLPIHFQLNYNKKKEVFFMKYNYKYRIVNNGKKLLKNFKNEPGSKVAFPTNIPITEKNSIIIQ